MQKVKGVKVTRKVKIVKQKFCIKKTHTLTIIAMNFVQGQLINSKKAFLKIKLANHSETYVASEYLDAIAKCLCSSLYILLSY